MNPFNRSAPVLIPFIWNIDRFPEKITFIERIFVIKNLLPLVELNRRKSSLSIVGPQHFESSPSYTCAARSASIWSFRASTATRTEVLVSSLIF